MNLAQLAINNRAVSYFAAMLIVVGGIFSFFGLGQLEDPKFTVKTAAVITTYPGASPRQVELEVTDRIELAIQELPEIDYLESFSRAGMSLIKVNIKPEFWSDRLPQVWDKLRNKIRDVESQLPPGAGRPVLLAAATTVLGVVPLLQDVFWIGLAITIMFGLTFGTVLTMVIVLTLYATLYRLKKTDSNNIRDIEEAAQQPT